MKKNIIAFLEALFINPRATGAILPSSNSLATEMASHVHLKPNQIVVELGAGTGVVTQALLDRGINPRQIIAIESSPLLAKKLQQRFRKLKVIQGNAVNLADLLGKDSRNVACILSSLPLRSLPKKVAHSILQQISQLLFRDSYYIQFTYSCRKDFFAMENLTKIYSKRIWKNLPPARVDIYKKF